MIPLFFSRRTPHVALAATMCLFLVACAPPAGNAALGAQVAAAPAADAAPTIVIVVRHGEKSPTPADDPVLDSAGARRADMLLDALRNANVGAVYVTQLARTRLTAQPVSAMLGAAPIVVGTGGGTAAHVQAVAGRVLAEQRGRTTLVVGHSNTVPLIVRALGGSAPDQLADHEYDNMFIVTVPASGAVTTVRARYGPPNPAPVRDPSMR